MTIYNLGSINVDHVYLVSHLPKPGETLAAGQVSQGLGGKGANQSVAIKKAQGEVCHIGAVGLDGIEWKDNLHDLGLEGHGVQVVNAPTGHAIITVADDGENSIVLYPGANQDIAEEHIDFFMSEMTAKDWLLFQNETNGQEFAVSKATEAGAKIAYVAAPFVADTVLALLPFIDLLSVNEVEAAELCRALGVNSPNDIPVPQLLMTLGAKGAIWIEGGKVIAKADAIKVDVIDTTGAGDTFFGYFLAEYDRSGDAKAALTLANRAAALKVTRVGTADAIPTLDEVLAFNV